MSVHDDHEPPPPDLHLVGSNDRPPPPATRNPVAERAVLGVLLSYPQLAEQLRPELDAGDFYEVQHGLIWDAIHAVATKGTAPDWQTVSGHLNRTGDLAKVGGPNYLHQLVQDAGIAANAPAYAADVRDASRLRALDTAGIKLRQLASTPDPNRIQAALEQAVETVYTTSLRFEAHHLHAPTGLRDLAWVSTGDIPAVPPPVWCRRTDGHALFYAGRVNGIFGDPEAAKTWLAQIACIEAMNTGQPAAIVDVDHNGVMLTVSRLLLLGANKDHLADPDLFRYYEPDDADELHATVRDLVALEPAVVVLDSIGEMLPMMGVKSVDNDEITAGLRSIANPLARVGACVITIDHLPKSAEARATGFAIGGGAKKRALDGSYIRAEVKLAPAPGALGKVALFKEKDRPGELSRVCNGKFVGEFILDSRTEHVTKAEIRPTGGAISEDGIFRPTHLMETVSRVVEDQPGITSNVIVSTVRGKATNVRAAIQRLLEDAYMTGEPGPRKSVKYMSLKPYREADDESVEEQF